MQNVAYAHISSVNFTAPATKRKRVLEGQSGHQSQSQPQFVIPPPSKEKMESFIRELSNTGKPALLSILPDYCDHSALSLPLPSLFEASALNLI